MSTTLTQRPIQWCAVGGVYRNPIEYVFQSDLEFMLVEVYRKIGSASQLIDTKRKRVIAGVCKVDVSSSLQSQLVDERDYNRAVISNDDNATVEYYIKYSVSVDQSGQFVMQSDSGVTRFAVNAALDTEAADYMLHVIGEATTVPPVNPPIEPPPPVVQPGSPTPSYYEKVISETVGINSAVCQETLTQTVYAAISGLTNGMSLFQNPGLTIPVLPGWYKVFFVDGNPVQFKIMIDNGAIETKQVCTFQDYFE